MKLNLTTAQHLLTGTAFLGLGLATGVGADKPAPATTITIQKPSWLTDFAFAVREAYDSNVYLSDQGVRNGAATKGQDSWVTTVSPKIGFNFVPLLGDQKTLQTLSFGYAPDFVTYHDQPIENYTAHRLANTIKGKQDAFSFNLDNAFSFIDGGKDGPIYLDGRSSYATAAVRERRAQWQDRAKISFQYDQEKWFVRPTAALTYYELMTNQRNPVGAYVGYDNYADRYDVNGGVDFGYKLRPQLAATLGYRYGHQYQQQYSFDAAHLSSPSDYQRVLVGLEGKPAKWLTASLQAGPDFRSYAGNTATHTTPVSDLSPVKYYGEAAIAAEASPKDAFAFKYKQWQWVASTGKLPYFESTYELTYRRKVTSDLSLELGGRLGSSDYMSGNQATSKRDDWQYTLAATLNYAITANLSANLAYSVDLGRNAQDGLPTLLAVQQREYERHIVALGAQFKF